MRKTVSTTQDAKIKDVRRAFLANIPVLPVPFSLLTRAVADPSQPHSLEDVQCSVRGSEPELSKGSAQHNDLVLKIPKLTLFA